MSVPSISDLKTWVGTLFTKDDWNFNCQKIVSWFSGGEADLVVNSLTASNGIDLAGSTLTNLGPATTGADAVNLDQAQTLLNKTSFYYPYSVASGKEDNNGDSAFLQKDSDTQVTVLAGSVNPDLVVIQSDGTVETITSNTVLTVGTTDGPYNIVKEKGSEITITTGAVNIGKVLPTSQNAGDYFLDNSTIPFKGYKYDSESGWILTPFVHLGNVVVSSGTATATPKAYNQNLFDINVYSKLNIPDYTAGVSQSNNTVYQAETNGYVSIYGYDSGGSGMSGYVGITDNPDIQICSSTSNDGTIEGYQAQYFIPKGLYYKFTGGNSTIKWFPCIL